MNAAANYNRLVASLLLVAGVGLFAWSTWGFVDRYYPQWLGRAGDGEAKIVKTEKNSKSVDYNVNNIVAAYLFGKTDQKKVAQKTKNAPATKLKLKLLGVMSSGDEYYARAMIQVNSKGMKTYSIGESIEGTDAQLLKVENEKVILDRKGNLESLAMARQKTKISRSKPGTS